MNYALVKDGVVVNVIWLNESNAGDFEGALKAEGRSVAIGDAYADGVFTRDGVPLLTSLEEAQSAIAELDAAVVELTYENVMLELGMA